MNHLSRRKAISFMAAGIAASSLCPTSAVLAQPAKALTRVSLRLDYLVTGEHAHFYAAQARGYFQEEGLEVDILEGAGSGQTLQQVGNKTNDFGVAGFDALVNARQEDIPAVMTACVFRRTPASVMSLQSTGIREPIDLEGKSIGVRAGSSPTILLPAFLAAAGVDPAKVQTINLDFSALIPALLQKRIDALAGFAPSQYPVLTGAAGEKIELLRYSDAGIVTLSTGIAVHPDTITDRPEICRGFIRAMQRGLAWTQSDPVGAAKMMAEKFPRSVKQEDAILAIEQVKEILYSARTTGQPLGLMDQNDVQDTILILQKYGRVRADFKSEGLYTNEFIDHAI